MTPNRVKQHRKRTHTTGGHMALIPFIDMMTILVVFLLLHTADVDILPNTQDIEVPQSVSDVKPRETLVVMLTRDSLSVAGERVASLAEVKGSDDPVFAPLKAALLGQSARVLGGREAAAVANREVTIMGDREVPYSVLKKIMATCTSADFGKVSLAVIEKERATRPGARA